VTLSHGIDKLEAYPTVFGKLEAYPTVFDKLEAYPTASGYLQGLARRRTCPCGRRSRVQATSGTELQTAQARR
jgi:hypothetical protein